MKKLYFKQKIMKITDHYEVYNEDQEIEYYVDEDFKFISFRANVTDADGEYVFSIEKDIYTPFIKFNINFRDGSNIILKNKFSILKNKMSIEGDDLSLRLEEDYFNYDVAVYNENETIAVIKRKYLSFSDTYELTIFDDYYTDIILAIAIGVDCIRDNNERKSQNDRKKR
ncbi:MAG: hypothetical protein GX675_00480 [Erysipelotrichaceae bacterium]|nr:hypothetical protein [Erysipelotrichaceae bacterium]